MKKCKLCIVASWVVGLAAVAWGALSLGLITIDLTPAFKMISIGVGITGIGFLCYQQPLMSCPRCVAANKN